jgi:hypothetical protein
MAEAKVATTEDVVAPEPDRPLPQRGDAAGEDQGGSIFGDLVDSLFGTGQSRRGRLTPTQHAARSVARSMSNQVAGQIGRQIGGRHAGTLAKAITRGVLGGLLRR